VPEILVTGGSGFIGGALLRRLVADGRPVRALARSQDAAEAIAASGAEPVPGDLADDRSLREAAAGCRVVFHVGGLNGTCLRDPSRLDRVNVDGTRAMVRAAAAVGVERIVYTSSAATIGERAGTVGTETTVHCGKYVTEYARSKHLAEMAAFEDAAKLGVELVALNPSSVQGPGRVEGTARLLIAYVRGRLRWFVDTRLSLVSIGDTVEAHLLAATRGVPGERYLVSGWSGGMDDALALLGRAAGVESPVRQIPGWVLAIGATMLGGAYRALGRDAPVCREAARTLRHGHLIDGSKAERDLGLRYTPPEVWLAETVEWYRAEGWV